MSNKYINRFDLLIYFVISFLINFAYFIFECDLKIGEIKGWLVFGGTFLWVIVMCALKVSYLYSSDKHDDKNSNNRWLAAFILITLVVGLSGYNHLATVNSNSFAAFLVAQCLPISLLSTLALVLKQKMINKINGGD
jgi:hypothetical protein